MTEANELRKLAEAATPGPWIASGVTSKIGGDRFMFVNVEPLGEVARLPLPDRPAKGYAPTICDQRYIAAANPATILALLDELSLLRSENEGLKTGIKRLSNEEEMCAETTGDDPFSMVYLAAKLAKAEAEIERLREALDTIATSFHGSNPSDAYADAPREDYLETVLMEARRFARAALSNEGKS